VGEVRLIVALTRELPGIPQGGAHRRRAAYAGSVNLVILRILEVGVDQEMLSNVHLKKHDRHRCLHPVNRLDPLQAGKALLPEENHSTACHSQGSGTVKSGFRNDSGFVAVTQAKSKGAEGFSTKFLAIWMAQGLMFIT
jgi:hypothetical protein